MFCFSIGMQIIVKCCYINWGLNYYSFIPCILFGTISIFGHFKKCVEMIWFTLLCFLSISVFTSLTWISELSLTIWQITDFACITSLFQKMFPYSAQLGRENKPLVVKNPSSNDDLELGPLLEQLDMAAARRSGRHRGWTAAAAAPAAAAACLPEREGDAVAPEVCLELCWDVDVGRLSRGVLDDEVELGEDLDEVTGLEDEVALALEALAGEAPGDVGLAAKLTRGARLKIIVWTSSYMFNFDKQWKTKVPNFPDRIVQLLLNLWYTFNVKGILQDFLSQCLNWA